MPITNDNKYKVYMYPSMKLVDGLYEFVNGNYWCGIEDDVLKKKRHCVLAGVFQKPLYTEFYII